MIRIDTIMATLFSFQNELSALIKTWIQCVKLILNGNIEYIPQASEEEPNRMTISAAQPIRLKSYSLIHIY